MKQTDLWTEYTFAEAVELARQRREHDPEYQRRVAEKRAFRQGIAVEVSQPWFCRSCKASVYWAALINGFRMCTACSNPIDD